MPASNCRSACLFVSAFLLVAQSSGPVAAQSNEGGHEQSSSNFARLVVEYLRSEGWQVTPTFGVDEQGLVEGRLLPNSVCDGEGHLYIIENETDVDIEITVRPWVAEGDERGSVNLEVSAGTTRQASLRFSNGFDAEICRTTPENEELMSASIEVEFDGPTEPQEYVMITRRHLYADPKDQTEETSAFDNEILCGSNGCLSDEIDVRNGGFRGATGPH